MFVVAAVLLLSCVVKVYAGYSQWNGIVRSIGHRGWSSIYPENTMVAVYASLDDAGSEGIEIDIQVASDSEIVLMHDTTLDRTTDCTGQTSSRPFYGYIDGCDAGSWKGAEFTGERVPLFHNITDVIYPQRLSQFVVLDLKDFPLDTFGSIYAYLDDKYGNQLYDHLIFGCWTYQCIDRAVVDLAPYYQMFITSVPLSIDEAASRGVDVISIAWSVVANNREYIANAQAAGMDVHVWTVNAVADIETALSYRVNGIISDYPERVMQIRDGTIAATKVIQ